jgi:hypothetical protein
MERPPSDFTEREPSGRSSCFELVINNTDLCSSVAPRRAARSASLDLDFDYVDDLEPLEMEVSRVKRQAGEELVVPCVTHKAKSRDCADRLPFVCVKKAVNKFETTLDSSECMHNLIFFS